MNWPKLGALFMGIIWNVGTCVGLIETGRGISINAAFIIGNAWFMLALYLFWKDQ